MAHRKWIAAGAVSALLGVAIGAFGAHALELPERYAGTYDTGVEYHLIHALGMIAASLAAAHVRRPRLAGWAAALFAVGTVLFSGSLYALSITEISAFGAVAPIGGASFLAGWALLAWSCLAGGGKP